MSLRDLLHETFSALAANKARSLLTLLGIVIGIGAVIAMTALIGGIKQSMMGDLGFDQARLVNISCWYGNGIQEADLEAMASEMASDYEYVTATNYGFTEVSNGSEKKDGQITGVRAEYAQATQVELTRGRWLSEREIENAALTAVIDQAGVKELWGNPDEDVVGKTLTIGQVQYKIVGVKEAQSMSGLGGVQVFLPFNTVAQRVSGSATLDSVMGFAHEGADMDAVAQHTEDWLAKHFNIPDMERENFIYVMTMKSLIDEVNATMASFQLLMTSVAAISLVVGGIGIMNMMLTNVTERIREIGLRKALGARRRDITRQFLLESVCLCLLGGVIGIALGYLGSYAFMGLAGSVLYGEGSDATLTPVIDGSAVLWATATCVAIGVAFGFYPAYRAARLDPVESLHYQ